MLEDRDCKVIVEAVIDLARKLGLECVAEGVESKQIWNALLELECDRGQGYYLGRPMDADRIQRMVMDAKLASRVPTFAEIDRVPAN
jgi:EAL domain-containing protein (putative c-di-GMP-specific phosphodiesterase class I)